MLRRCLVCVICDFKLCIMIVHILKMCTFLFYAHFMNIFFDFWGVLNLVMFSLQMLRWFLVCVICNSKSFYSLVFKLCIMIDHTLNMCLSFLCIIVFKLHFFLDRNFKLNIISHKCSAQCPLSLFHKLFSNNEEKDCLSLIYEISLIYLSY